MSAARFVSFVKANLVGKRVHSAFVADTGWPRIVFSDGSVVECGANIVTVADRFGITPGGAIVEGGGLVAEPTISTAESVPVEGK